MNTVGGVGTVSVGRMSEPYLAADYRHEASHEEQE